MSIRTTIKRFALHKVFHHYSMLYLAIDCFIKDNMYHNIIWDVDGTLFDTYPSIARTFQAALRDFGKTADQDWIESLAKVSLKRCLTTLADHSNLQEDALDKAFDAHYQAVKAADQPPFPGVATICEYIVSQGGRNVVVTHRGRAGTEELLAAHGLGGLFAGCIAGDDGYARKPDPAPFKAALEKFDLKREETLTVGDREIDILGGKAAGLYTCLFGADIFGCSPDMSIASFAELHIFLKSDHR